MKKYVLSILFLLILISAHAQLIRGPYLQAATSTSMVIRWRTEIATNSLVRFGASSAVLNQKVEDEKLVTDHEIKVFGLNPASKYFYSVGSSTITYLGDESTFFETAPVPGTIKKYRFGIMGDCGTNSAFQGNVRDQLSAYLGTDYMNALLLLGDNAYPLGTDPEYQSGFFNQYKDTFLKKFPVFSTPGNHDYNNDNPERQKDHKVAYYDIFSPPTNGEAGGVASGTKSYYSFDYGNVHFLSLDSYGREDQETRLYDTLGKQVLWVKADLAANKNKGWIVAFWHHPPYSQGSRNSETETDLIKIRENFIRILERSGVDLILCGHSHVYERTRLIKGFYDYSDKFNNASHNLSLSSGKYDGSDNSCPYIKISSENKGTVYVVSGSAGQLGLPAPGFPHKAMYYSNADIGGSMMLEVEGNRLDARWIGSDGNIRDQFTMEKDVNLVKEINLEAGKSVDLEASFIGKYLWNNGATSRLIKVSPKVDTEYIVKDAQNCVQDIFRIKVNTPLPVKLISFTGMADAENAVQLKWTTEPESQLNYFEIQRSANKRDFDVIGKVNANAGSNKAYGFSEVIEKNTFSADSVYYRLKMVEPNAAFVYSKIIAVKLNGIVLATEPNAAVDIEIVPNPSFANDIQVRLIGQEFVSAFISVMDISGKVIFGKAMKLTKNLSPFLPAQIAKGTYFLKAVIGNKTITRKFMIL